MSAPMENIAAYVEVIAELAKQVEGGERATETLRKWLAALEAVQARPTDTPPFRDPDDAICDGGGMGGLMAMDGGDQ